MNNEQNLRFLNTLHKFRIFFRLLQDLLLVAEGLAHEVGGVEAPPGAGVGVQVQPALHVVLLQLGGLHRPELEQVVGARLLVQPVAAVLPTKVSGGKKIKNKILQNNDNDNSDAYPIAIALPDAGDALARPALELLRAAVDGRPADGCAF